LAYEHYKIYQEHKNQLITEDYNKQITESKTKYDAEKKEAENNQLKIENDLKSNEIATKQAEQKTLIISFIALLLFISGLAFFMNYKRKIKAQKQLQQEEKLRFKAVIEAEEKERIRIAKELHDGLGQLLSTAKLNVASLEGNVDKEDEILVKNASDLIDNAVKEVRTISHNMMPVALTQLGLISAVKELTNKMNDSGLLSVKFESNIETRLNSSIEISIYRVIQEILNNTIKHAQAKVITISLTKEKERLTLQISDDGVGFNTNEIENSKGIGWKSIFSRIAMLNGDINVDSSKDKGTNLLVSIPVNE
jgi:signal transduction histidine kinase